MKKREKIKKGSNHSKFEEALCLPKVLNCNPQSLYNKKDEFLTLLEQEEISLACISESWERENWPISELLDDLKNQNYTIISNVYQRKERGGRPIIIVKNSDFLVQNLTQTVISIPWGVEIVWCCLTPKNVRTNFKIQKIIVASIYSKPNSRKKTALLDHISDTFTFLSSKYDQGLHWLLAGDTNDLKLDTILSLHPNMRQVVTKRTRLKSKPPGILDTITTTLSNYYQIPEVYPPLRSDTGMSESDHLIVMMSPIDRINNKSARVNRSVMVRKMPESKILVLEETFRNFDWSKLYAAESAHEKAEIFQTTILEKLDEIIPEKKITFSSDDSAFFTPELKQLDRTRKRIYHKQGRSKKWKSANKKFKMKMKNAKFSYYDRIIKDLKVSNPKQWYSKMKRIMSDNNGFSSELSVDEISHLSDEEQANMLASHFSSVSQEFEPLKNSDVCLPEIKEDVSEYFSKAYILPYIQRIKVNKSNTRGDIPAKVIKRFAEYFCEPFTNIMNTIVRRGEYPYLWKLETQTLIPKVFPVQEISQLRNISGLLNFDKISQSIIGDLMMQDMQPNIDPSQYGNQRKTSINHYLMNMIHEILSTNDRKEPDSHYVAIASFIDWKEAFPRMCHILGIKSFIETGVRPALLPCLVNFFQDRRMRIKWKGILSKIQTLNGSGPMGSTIGLLEYIGQSNNNTQNVPQKQKFKWVDDLSTIEKINLNKIGVSSYNVRNHVPSDVPLNNGFIPGELLNTQKVINDISEWTKNQKMCLNKKKSNMMIFNFSKKRQFTTRVRMEGELLPIVNKTKILGTVLTDQLKWDENTKNIVQRANMRMQMVRKASKFTQSTEDLKQIYMSYIRSVLEQSAVIWNSSLTQENVCDLERIQKNFLRILYKEKYHNYDHALQMAGLENLQTRRNKLSLKFAEGCLENNKTKHLFPLNEKVHQMNTRGTNKFKVLKSKTKRMEQSTVPSLQKLLNQKHYINK